MAGAGGGAAVARCAPVVGGAPSLSLVVAALRGGVARVTFIEGRVLECELIDTASDLTYYTVRIGTGGPVIRIAGADVARVDALPSAEFPAALEAALRRDRSAVRDAARVPRASRRAAALRGDVGLGAALAPFGFSAKWDA